MAVTGKDRCGIGAKNYPICAKKTNEYEIRFAVYKTTRITLFLVESL